MTTQPLLDAKDIEVTFKGKRRGEVIRAVNQVNVQINAGETLAVVGESGSGKSTLARAILRLIPLKGGTIVLNGLTFSELARKELRDARKHAQMVFQDPYSSLDPLATIGNVIEEPLQVHTDLDPGARQERVRELLQSVGLPADYAGRYSYEFSGGQRQRIAIARALAVNPSLIVLDEAVSALDVSTQNQVLELLQQLREEHNLAYLFISHNLSVVRWIADRTAVMYLGRIVEEGPSERLHHNPAHPYSQSLLSAMPIPDPVEQRARQRIVLQGDPPDPAAVTTGCAFRTRCAHAMEICETVAPTPRPVDGGGWATCHLLPEA